MKKLKDHSIEGKLGWYLLLVFVVQFIYPVSVGNRPIQLIIYQIFYCTLMIGGIILARDRPREVIALIGAVCLWIPAGIFYAFYPNNQLPNVIGYLCVVFFQIIVTRILLIFIFNAKKVSLDVIYAACAVYLLLGGIFIPIYGIIESLTWFPDMQAHAFVDGSIAYDGAIPWQMFNYFSYATLTTLGYGDLLPITWWARSVATIEAIVGVLYLAIIMARLVSLYSADVDREIIEDVIEDAIEDGFREHES